MIKSGYRKPRKLTKYERTFIDKYGHFMIFCFSLIFGVAMYVTLKR